jgi:hypothetical protein
VVYIVATVLSLGLAEFGPPKSVSIRNPWLKIFAFLAVKSFRVFGVFRVGESRISGGDKKDLLNHVFIQDPFFVSVGVEQKHRVPICVNHPSVRIDIVGQHTAGQGFGFAVAGAAA